MLFLDEVLAEGDEEQDAQDAAEERGDEHLPEVDFDLVALALQDVEGRQGEDGARHHTARAAADALDDDVLRQRVVLARQSREAYGDDGDRDGGLKHLSDLQAEVGGGSGE